MIVCIRTDSSEAQIVLINESQRAEKKWHAHRELSNTLLQEIEKLLKANSAEWSDLSGVVVFKGPGSFTGLRIGITVANTLSNSLTIPVVGVQTKDWVNEGLRRLEGNENDAIVVPEYGGEANITKPRK